MKKSIIYLLPLMLLSVFFTSCSKDKDNTPEPREQTATSFFEATIDGEAFKASGINAYATTFTDSYVMYGVGVSGFVMYVSVNENLSVGTHQMDGNSTNAYISYGDGKALATILEGGSGSVTIEKKTPTNVIGTFQFEAVNFDNPSETMVVTEGKFNVKFR